MKHFIQCKEFKNWETPIDTDVTCLMCGGLIPNYPDGDYCPACGDHTTPVKDCITCGGTGLEIYAIVEPRTKLTRRCEDCNGEGYVKL